MSLAKKRDPFAVGPAMDELLAAKLAAIRSEIRAEYLESHTFPWIIGFSGGKDSTLVLQLVFETLLEIPPDDRTRPIHVVSNDTLVESPLVTAHVVGVAAEVRAAADAWKLPITVVETKPDADSTFWVNLIGRGYPPPNRTFRWCTDRMKIAPTSRYIRDQVAASGEVILLLGVRRSESATRAGVVARYDNGQRLNGHNDLPGCMVFRPIVELRTDEVWESLAFCPPPWGGTHNAIFKLYMDAGGGECLMVTSKADAPSCGSNSSRFGCWTCTVVEKDRSLEGFVESGFSEFAPLLEFRDWLVKIRDDPKRRSARRRNGKFTVSSEGVFIPGPFTFETREEILTRLVKLQSEVQHPLISDDEVARIRAIWAQDAAQAAQWSADAAAAV